MLKGKTPSGFEYEISDENLNNFELLEAMAEIEDDPLQVPRVIRLLLGKEGKNRLMDHLRKEDGTVPTDDVANELKEILTSSDNVKN